MIVVQVTPACQAQANSDFQHNPQAQSKQPEWKGIRHYVANREVPERTDYCFGQPLKEGTMIVTGINAVFALIYALQILESAYDWLDNLEFVVEIAFCVVSVIAIIGIRKDDHMKLRPYIYYLPVYIVLGLVFNFIDLSHFRIVNAVWNSLMLVIDAYNWVCMYNLYRSMREEKYAAPPPYEA